MSHPYVAALVQLDWLLEAIEAKLEEQSNRDLVTEAELAGLVTNRRASPDEVAAALYGLEALGVVSRSATGWNVRRGALAGTEQYRRGVRDGARADPARTTADSVTLVAALPSTIAARARHSIEQHAADLRAALVDLIACAERRLVLASPFWDEETADELHSLLARRVAAGVMVDLLGRAVGGPTLGGRVVEDLAGRLGPNGCRAFAWSRFAARDPFGSETFHFKVAVADDGARAYVGTANFTVSGLRSRMELGIVARGPLARSLALILDAVLGT